METTYTQQIDEKTGEIKYVPNTPPPPPPQGGNEKTERQSAIEREVESEMGDVDYTPDPNLSETLDNLLNNAKRLRYDRRLETGKLDGRRLTAYKTSKRLFKKKAINKRNYQFTFLLDTSGSMLYEHDDNGKSRMAMAMDAVARTVKALDEVDVQSSIFAMNSAFTEIKPFEDTFDDEAFTERVKASISGVYEDEGREVHNAGGTSEWVAYEQTIAYLKDHTHNGRTNVVIVLSDGEPGVKTETTPVKLLGQETVFVPTQRVNNRVQNLAKFWDNQTAVKAFGIGIQQKAKQVPTNKVVDDVSTLPSVLSNLLTELML